MHLLLALSVGNVKKTNKLHDLLVLFYISFKLQQHSKKYNNNYFLKSSIFFNTSLYFNSLILFCGL